MAKSKSKYSCTIHDERLGQAQNEKSGGAFRERERGGGVEKIRL